MCIDPIKKLRKQHDLIFIFKYIISTNPISNRILGNLSAAIAGIKSSHIYIVCKLQTFLIAMKRSRSVVHVIAQLQT